MKDFDKNIHAETASVLTRFNIQKVQIKIIIKQKNDDHRNTDHFQQLIFNFTIVIAIMVHKKKFQCYDAHTYMF